MLTRRQIFGLLFVAPLAKVAPMAPIYSKHVDTIICDNLVKDMIVLFEPRLSPLTMLMSKLEKV